MNLNDLLPIVSLIIALSVASERLVEIVKGLIPALDQVRADPSEEGRRRAMLHALAVLAGMVSAALTGATIGWEALGLFPGSHPFVQCLGLGFLVSGGSGFWNSILGYLVNVKAIKGVEAQALKEASASGGATPNAQPGKIPAPASGPIPMPSAPFVHRQPRTVERPPISPGVHSSGHQNLISNYKYTRIPMIRNAYVAAFLAVLHVTVLGSEPPAKSAYPGGEEPGAGQCAGEPGSLS